MVSASQLLKMNETYSKDDEKLLSLIEESGKSASVLINEILCDKAELQLANERSDLYEMLDACTYLLNFSNAIKFSFENTDINVGLNEVNNEAVISIQDQGMGIPNIISHNIFDAATKTGRAGTANEPSFGLGLSISKQIVEEHGGRIWFENNESTGSTFFVALPLIA